jgi:tetratricopeptide (TPR) repeat protein
MTMRWWFLPLASIYLACVTLYLYNGIGALRKEAAFLAIKAHMMAAQKPGEQIDDKTRLAYYRQGKRIFQRVQNTPGYYPQIDLGLNTAGKCLMLAGDNEAALETFTRALTYNPLSLPNLVGRGSVATELGRYELAIESYRLAEELYPYDWRIAYGLGDCWNRSGRPDQALPYFETAWKRNNQHSFVLLQVAVAHFNTGNRETAARLARKLKRNEIKPEFQPLYDSLLAALKKWESGSQATKE